MFVTFVIYFVIIIWQIDHCKSELFCQIYPRDFYWWL